MNKKISNITIFACLFTALASHAMEEKEPQSHDVNRDWEVEQKVWTLYNGLFTRGQEEQLQRYKCVTEEQKIEGASKWLGCSRIRLAQQSQALEKIRQEMKEIKHNIQCSEEIKKKLWNFCFYMNDHERFGELTISAINEDKAKSVINCSSLKGGIYLFYPPFRNAIASAINGGYYHQSFIDIACSYNDLQLTKYIVSHRDAFKKHGIDISTDPYPSHCKYAHHIDISTDPHTSICSHGDKCTLVPRAKSVEIVKLLSK